MGLFRRWFGKNERRSGDAALAAARPETAAPQAVPKAISDEGSRPDMEPGEGIREKIQHLLDTSITDVTLKQGIEMMIREEVPEIVDIIDVTDHAAGQNPYSAASKK